MICVIETPEEIKIKSAAKLVSMDNFFGKKEFVEFESCWKKKKYKSKWIGFKKSAKLYRLKIVEWTISCIHWIWINKRTGKALTLRTTNGCSKAAFSWNRPCRRQSTATESITKKSSSQFHAIVDTPIAFRTKFDMIRNADIEAITYAPNWKNLLKKI